METNENGLIFNFKVENDNPIMVNARKKERTKYGILCFIATLPFLMFAILSSIGENTAIWVPILFGGFVLLCLAAAIYFLVIRNGTAKDNNKNLEYEFLEDGITIAQNDLTKNKKKYLIRCLYSQYANKQYISKLIEYNDKFEIKVYTGTVNGVPQYKKHILPKNVIAEDKNEEFKEFLKQKMKNDYITK